VPTRWTPREINLQIVLNLVREHEPISRAELARRMKIGRGMVTYLTAELIAQGALYEGDTVDSPRGRRPQMLYVRTHDRLVVAIDIRFSSTFVMLTDFSGNSIALEVVRHDRGPRRARAGATGAHRAHARRARGCPPLRGDRSRRAGHGGSEHRTCVERPAARLRNVDIRGPLEARVGDPGNVENAPIACALARMWLGQPGATVPTDFVYVTVSDGIGAGVVVNARSCGDRPIPGEFGHVPLTADGPDVPVRWPWVPRGLHVQPGDPVPLSRPGFLARPRRRALLPSSGVTIAEVVSRAVAGRSPRWTRCRETARHLGRGLAVMIKTLSPSQIIVGGEITEAGISSSRRSGARSPRARSPISPPRRRSSPSWRPPTHALRGGAALVFGAAASPRRAFA
jgi:predicted NBD/HSP70 family sugar kinase